MTCTVELVWTNLWCGSHPHPHSHKTVTEGKILKPKLHSSFMFVWPGPLSPRSHDLATYHARNTKPFLTQFVFFRRSFLNPFAVTSRYHLILLDFDDFHMLHQRGQLGEDPRCSVADVRGQYQWWVMSETHVLLRYWSSWGGWACKIGDGHRSGAYVCNNIMLIWTWLAWIALFNIFVFMKYCNEPWKRHYKLCNINFFLV